MNYKRSNDLIIYLFFAILIISSPLLFLRYNTVPALKYYQIIDLFRQDKVISYDLKLGSGELSLVVEEKPKQMVNFIYTMPSDELFKTNPKLCFEQYKKILEAFRRKNVIDFNFMPNSNNIIFKLVSKPAVMHVINYKLPSIELFIFDTKDIIKKHNEEHPDKIIQADYKKASSSTSAIVSILFNSILPMVILGVGIYFVMKYMSKGAIGQDINAFKSRNSKYIDKGPKIYMKDVAALQEEKEEIQDLIQFLKDPNRFDKLGAKIPTGVLLIGPPGTGKTLLAKALAGEAGVPFFFIAGSAFVELYVGVGASRVRELFEQAKKHSPCIIFIDEIDAVGKKRENSSLGGHDERDQTLNQLLVEMDGFKKNSGVIVIAATNIAHSLDKALIRPGRFDRQIYVGYPDVKGREEILRVHTRNKPLAPNVNLGTVSKATIGFTGADLANLMNEAALLAVKDNKKSVRMQDIDKAVIKVIVGTEKKSKRVTVNNKKSTAYHESGHAICAYYCDNYDDVNMVSIIPTGPAGGFTLSMPKEDDMYKTDKAMFEDIVVSLGGRAAEKIILNETSTGASEDIRAATLRARDMVTIYGFSEELGNVVYDNSVLGVESYLDPLSHSAEVRSKIDFEIKEIMDKAYNEAIRILTVHRDKLIQLAEYLLKNEKIDAESFVEMMREPIKVN